MPEIQFLARYTAVRLEVCHCDAEAGDGLVGVPYDQGHGNEANDARKDLDPDQEVEGREGESKS